MGAEGPGLFGRPAPRLEDRALLRGEGRFLDDLAPAGRLSAVFVRSPHAHAAFGPVDLSAARGAPGVVAAFAAADLRPWLASDRLVVALPSKSLLLAADRPILAEGETAHVGEAVALILAESRAAAEDAAALVDIDFDPLPAVADCRDALAADAPRAHRSLPDNRLGRMTFAYGDVDAAFARAAHRVAGAYAVHRGGGHAMETRGVLANLDRARDVLDVWSSTQTPHALKKALCDLLAREEDRVAVHTPDVGGGFGPKLVTYPEEIAVAAAALAVGRPVKWVEDRSEHFVATTQERDQHWDIEAAFDADGRILGLRGRLLHDHGAYTARGLNVPYGSAVTAPLPYNVPAYHIDVDVVLTNKTPVTPIRGAGQPQGVYVMERLLDRAAAALGLGREEIRARNLVRADQMPARKGLRLRGGGEIVLDGGDYPATQATALEAADWAGFCARREAARGAGRRLGIGLANYVEGTGRGPYEEVSVRVSTSGRVLVTTGAAAMGQGLATMLAQIAGEQLGGDLDLITVRTGDTSTAGYGFGGFNSRQTVVAGASAHEAAKIVRRKLLAVAGEMMEVARDDLEIAPGGVVRVKGAEDKRIGFAELARAAVGLPGYPLPGLDAPGLQAKGGVVIDDMAYSNGTAVAEVEVDVETGGVRVLRFTLAHDCGRMVNPMMVDGQVTGGLAHGLGNALFEWMGFDDMAQPITATFADYLLVTAAEMPPVTLVHRETPSPLNALGVKGVGESGVIPGMAAVASAVDDALSEFAIHANRAPLSPQTLRSMLRETTRPG